MATNVLLIDDDPDDITIMIDVITEIDETVNCLPFLDPREAVRALKYNRLVEVPDLILIDVNMPWMKGDVCLQSIRSLPHLDAARIAMISTSMNEQDVETFLASGAEFAVSKPVSLQGYRDLVKMILPDTGPGNLEKG